ncbi:hypothetical protein [Streptomyces sp. NPDC058382]|uniref:hypothetical protein n=1 Tax=unclassified Streptomyces TaxID=2593676 RepID=UPI00363ABB2E
MKFSAGVPRPFLTLAAAGALVMASAAGAGAVSAAGQPAPAGHSIRADQSRGGGIASTGSYRGVQGGNLCLLSRCSVGESAPGRDAGPSNTQGFNLCLLALCTVRP